MRNVKLLCSLIQVLLLGAAVQAGESGFWGSLPEGPFSPGFMLIETSDASRSFPSADGEAVTARPMRIYVWYPAKPTSASRMTLDDLFRMAKQDLRTSLLSELVHLIISKGIREAGVTIEGIQAAHPGLVPIEESVLNWLGLHFLYWWGREDEAVVVFELNASLYPGSWRAHDSLGEAYADRGRTDDAVRSYRSSLELNPENQNAKAALERLSPPVKRAPSP